MHSEGPDLFLQIALDKSATSAVNIRMVCLFEGTQVFPQQLAATIHAGADCSADISQGTGNNSRGESRRERAPLWAVLEH